MAQTTETVSPTNNCTDDAEHRKLVRDILSGEYARRESEKKSPVEDKPLDPDRIHWMGYEGF